MERTLFWVKVKKNCHFCISKKKNEISLNQLKILTTGKKIYKTPKIFMVNSNFIN